MPVALLVDNPHNKLMMSFTVVGRNAAIEVGIEVAIEEAIEVGMRLSKKNGEKMRAETYTRWEQVPQRVKIANSGNFHFLTWAFVFFAQIFT
jgi:hypothetical protein